MGMIEEEELEYILKGEDEKNYEGFAQVKGLKANSL